MYTLPGVTLGRHEQRFDPKDFIREGFKNHHISSLEDIQPQNVCHISLQKTGRKKQGNPAVRHSILSTFLVLICFTLEKFCITNGRWLR